MKIIHKGKIEQQPSYVGKKYQCNKCNTIIKIELNDIINEFNMPFLISNNKPYKFVLCPLCSKIINLDEKDFVYTSESSIWDKLFKKIFGKF